MQPEKIEILSEMLGGWYRTRDQYLFYCPFCEHHKKKLSINIKKNLFKCWVCDTSGKDIYYLIKKFGNHSQRHRWSDLATSVSLSEFDNLFSKVETIIKKQKIKLPEEFISLASASLSSIANAALSYLNRRGITRQDILRWKMGFCDEGEYRNRIIIPSFDSDGYCNYFIARSYTDDWLKYKNPALSKNIVFNELLIDWTKPVVLVEGVFDAVRAENSIPLLGSTLNEESQIYKSILDNGSIVYVALDRDAEKKSLKIIKTLLTYDIEVWKIDTSNCEDVGSMTDEEFLIKKKKAEQIDHTNLILYETMAI
jgi:DNA primase